MIPSDTRPCENGRQAAAEDLRHLTVILGILLLGIYLFWVWRFWPFTVDDAYISARYARNLVRGYGLVYNPGERVMGYTNLSLTLIEALVEQFGLDGVLAAKIIGVAAGAGVLGLTFLLARQAGGSIGAATLAVAFLAVYPPLAISAVMGIETTLFVLFLLMFLLLFLRFLDRPGGAAFQFLLAASLWMATVTRPEGLGVALLSLVLSIAGIRPSGRVAIRQIGWGAIYGLMLAPVLIWLSVYYGSPVPNTFFAKTASGWMPAKYLAGLVYVVMWLRDYQTLLLLPPLLWALKVREGKRAVVLAVFLAFYAAYVIYAGGDWMPGYRFLLPAIPLYFILASLGLDRVWQILRSHFLPAGHLWGIVLFLCFVTLSLPTMVKEDQYVLSRARGYQQAHFAVGMWLRENSSPDASVALMDIGLIGYVSDRYVLDITGLTSREVARIAHRGGGWALAPEEIAIQVADYVLSQEPDYIVLAHVTPSLDLFAGWRFDWAIFHSPSFSARYQHIFTVQHTDDYYLSVFGKQNSTE
ncbi:MAG: hypothetical protein J7575_06895 [Chloroflexi bacterium]|nr:hypothetical protein [Chloroflexota bacterium]